ncbi:MAG: hypothetical protein HYT73_00650 [Candidatus Aenigmarchaeota archaeon]|nr:hypothetical protein [Candidatus Aenigmarchaeota archaeon]
MQRYTPEEKEAFDSALLDLFSDNRPRSTAGIGIGLLRATRYQYSATAVSSYVHDMIDSRVLEDKGFGTYAIS